MDFVGGDVLEAALVPGLTAWCILNAIRVVNDNFLNLEKRLH